MAGLPNPRTPFPPVRSLARDEVQLLLVSSTLLFTELLFIRWIPANVKYVGFFSNFLLMASFLGIGLGIILGRNGRRLTLSPFGPLLAIVFVLVTAAQLNVKVSPTDEIFFGLELSRSADVNFIVLPLVVVLVTALMASLALPLGPLLRSMPPLRAYLYDIVGSMMGIAGFALLALFNIGPVAWFTVVGALVLLQALGRGVTPWSAVGGGAIGLAIAVSASQLIAGTETWSPYYRITVLDSTLTTTTTRGDGEDPRTIIVDGIPHQELLTADQAASGTLHGQIYRWFPDRPVGRVLVIGAGSGSDVGLALEHGATSVDAVEIDPEIVRIGRQFHPERPYDDPRVHRFVNDGRAFLRGATGEYDLVIFALTDSLTLVSSTANVRLESFLFTEEAFAAARDHLADDGIFVMYNFYREPWLIEKLATMVADVHGHEPLVRLPGDNSAVIAAGPGIVQFLASGALDPAESDEVPVVGEVRPAPATDDWPFLYLRTPGIALYYLAAIGFLLAFALVAVFGSARLAGAKLARFSPHFFVLGVAFLLLETRSLVSFSLLFGTTWFVNALTFFAILGSVLLAILVNARWRLSNPAPLYAALFASIAIAWILPPEALLIDPPAVRYLVAGAVAFAPVFFANLVFTHSFRDTASADMSFASNLLGAMVGGALEYLALLTGFRALLVVVAGLYVLAFILSRRVRLLADVDLVPSPSRP